MISDVAQSIREGPGLNEKTWNPLPGAFAVAWALWNWERIAVLLGGGEMAPKLKLLEDVPSDWGTLAVWPLLSALGYIFIMPQIAYRLQQYNLMVNRWRSDDKLDYEESRAQKRAKVAEARAKADAAEFDRTAHEEQWHNQIAQLDADKQRLEHQLHDMEHQRDSFENTEHEENPSLQSKVAELEQKNQRLEERVEQVISDRKQKQELLTAKVERINELEAKLSEVEPKQQ